LKELLFNNFDDIAHYPLKIYNRAVFFSNLYEDSGKVFAQDYANQFSIKDRLAMAQTIAAVKRLVVKRVQALVTEGLEFPEYLATPDPEVVK